MPVPFCEKEEHASDEALFFRLDKEIVPNGNRILYFYDTVDRLSNVQAVSSSGKQFSSLQICYDKESMRVVASDGQFVTYNLALGLLNEVLSSSKPKIVYSYTQVGNSIKLYKKELPENHFVSVYRYL